MADHRSDPRPSLDERAIARKYGIRELIEPDTDQVRALLLFLDSALATGRCPGAPKTAALVVADFLHATTVRQHITKGPLMTAEEYDALQAPYYAAARIIGQLQRARQEGNSGALYQTTWISLTRFIALLRTLLDPSTPWLRTKEIPEDVRVSMAALREFLARLPELRRKTRQ